MHIATEKIPVNSNNSIITIHNPLNENENCSSMEFEKVCNTKNRGNRASRTVDSNKMAKIRIMSIQKIFVSNEFALVEIFEVENILHSVRLCPD